MNFKDFLKQSWAEYIVPLAGPVIVFALSSAVTNIGWVAIPACLVVTGIVSGLKTWDLYNRWYAVESIMNRLRADGHITTRGDKG